MAGVLDKANRVTAYTSLLQHLPEGDAAWSAYRGRRSRQTLRGMLERTAQLRILTRAVPRSAYDPGALGSARRYSAKLVLAVSFW